MDDLAERLGLDRVEIRRRNATRPGDVNPQGFVDHLVRDDRVPRRGRRETIADGAPPAAARLAARASATRRCSTSGGGARIYRSDGCGAIVKLDDFGKVSLLTGASEIGQGSETVLAMIVAETLGVAARARGGRQLRHRGQAVGRRRAREPHHVHRRQRRAPGRARSCASKLLAHGRPAMLDEPATRLAVGDGWVLVNGQPERGWRTTAWSAPATSARAGRTLVAEAFYDPPNEMLDKDLRGNVSADVRLRGPGALVDVDEATGQVQVRQGRLRARRGPRAQPAGRRGADPRRHPHGARLRALRGAASSSEGAVLTASSWTTRCSRPTTCRRSSCA